MSNLFLTLYTSMRHVNRRQPRSARGRSFQGSVYTVPRARAGPRHEFARMAQWSRADLRQYGRLSTLAQASSRALEYWL